MRTLVKGGIIVNEGRAFRGSLVIDGENIECILPDDSPVDPPNDSPVSGQRFPRCHPAPCDAEIDATGCYVLPGIIDEHVHFREPGMTEKADIETESAAAAAGGVTSFFDMPNTIPQTTTLEALEEKQRLAEAKSHVNYAFFFGATRDNAPLIEKLDRSRVPGVKLFMGSSTGNMLVDDDEALNRIFAAASRADLPLMTHCEDTAIIERNMAEFKQRFGDDPDIFAHQLIRSEEACLASTIKAIELAILNQTRLHLAHISTKEEIELMPSVECRTKSVVFAFPLITAEATVGHLLFSTVDYNRLGTRIKVNPSIKSVIDQTELREALMDKRISTVATDHAPHLLSQKQGGCAKAASGMPMVQFSLPAMLSLVDEGVLTIERMVELMAHNPATIFEVRQRGFLRPGYKADIAIVRPDAPWTLTADMALSRCKWSPLEGETFRWRVEKTICNGHTVYDNGIVDRDYTALPVLFR